MQTPDVFRSVLSSDDVWRADPVDVPEVHAAARAAFDAMIEPLIDRRENDRTVSLPERTLVIRGNAGTGKTHLMRAFRTRVHETGRGFFAYMQMTVSVDDYSRYVLNNVIESLSQPYNTAFSNQTSLEHISRSLLDQAQEQNVSGSDFEPGEDFDAEEIAEGLERLPAYKDVEPGILIALLLMQRNDPAVTRRAIKYLRCDPLTERESRLLGGLHALTRADHPSLVICWLANIISMTYDRPLIVCVDQLEAFYVDAETAGPSFRKAVAALLAIVDHPNIVAIISALDEYYAILSKDLTASQIDRLEGDVKPILLSPNTTEPEVAAVLKKRLRFLYEYDGVRFDEDTPLYPFDPRIAENLSGLNLRIALRAMRAARERSIATRQPPTLAVSDTIEKPPADEAPALDLDEAWNSFRFTAKVRTPDAVSEIETLLARAIDLATRELPASRRVRAQHENASLRMTLASGALVENSLVAITNRKPAFGHLAREALAAQRKATGSGLTTVLVRNDQFPRSPRSQIFKTLGEIVARGGRLVVLSETDLRTIGAFFAFDSEHASKTSYDTWLLRSKPLTSLPGMVALLRLEGIEEMQLPLEVVDAVEHSHAGETANHPVATSKNSATSAASTNGTATQHEVAREPEASPAAHVVPPNNQSLRTEAPAGEAIELGERASGAGRFSLNAKTLTRHTAIFGGAGSGKTTLAFSLLEATLARGIPAILIDRKGDLATFADPTAWQRDVDALTAERRAFLRERVDVVLYTPGDDSGRNLSISTVPSGLGKLASNEREQESRIAAEALSSLVGWTATQQNRQAIVGQAVAALAAAAPDAAMSLASLIDFIDAKDPMLLAAIGKLDPKLLDKVVQDLESLRLNGGPLVDGSGESIEIERLLGTGAFASGKTRLSIISTKFLGESKSQLFWVSRLLSELARYASQRPKPNLQALVFFDEADVYLPATSKPPTKIPMENLLKRARSAGLGLVLATQSPGDLDYKSKENITTWLIGRVSQPQALKKLEDVFGPAGAGALAKVPTLTVGNFYGITEESRGAVAFKADRPALDPAQLDEVRILELAAST